MTTQDFERKYRLGVIEYRNSPVDIEIEYSDGCLSIYGDYADCFGQIDRFLRDEKFMYFVEGWDQAKVDRLLEIWKRWHLNDMRPGTPKQMEVIRRRQAMADIEDQLHRRAPYTYAIKKGYNSYYDMELDWLKNEGLEYDGDYLFGNAWLKEEVPEEVLDWLRNPNSEEK